MGENNKDTENELKVKSYKKLLNFYKIIFEPSFKDLSKTNNTILYDCFSSMFKNKDSVSNEGITFEKITLDNNHIFASICRTSDLDVLTEIRNSKGTEIEDTSDFILESYTYFYINFEKMGVSVIKTQKIPSPDGYIKSLISNNSFINLSLEPFKKNDNEIKDMLVNRISLSFYDNSQDFIELKYIDNEDCEISEFKFEAKLKKVKKNFVSNLMNKYKNSKEVKKLSVSSDTEEVDLIKSIFTKQVSIELTKDYKKDFSKIEETLKNELLKIINA